MKKIYRMEHPNSTQTGFILVDENGVVTDASIMPDMRHLLGRTFSEINFPDQNWIPHWVGVLTKL